jgi:excisionase family DNA binding protein
MKGTAMEKHLSYAEISEKLNIPLRSLYLYNKEGRGPRTVRVGRHLRVSQDDLEIWLAKEQK